MLGIIIKDYYESFCLKKNLISLLFVFIIFSLVETILMNI